MESLARNLATMAFLQEAPAEGKEKLEASLKEVLSGIKSLHPAYLLSKDEGLQA